MRDLDLVIEPGERILLLGASGSGKSTLLRALAGVLGDADDGESTGDLTLDGAPPAAGRGRSGLVLQDPDAQVVLARAGDDVAFACENLGVPREEIWPRVDAALDAVGLDIGREHPTWRLSGGQKQRLAIAGILAMRPGLMLLDEPTANVDPEGAVSVRDAVVAAARATGATLVVVEHRVALWADVVDRVIVLGGAAEDGGGGAGGVVADGAPAAVFARHGRSLTESGVWVPGVPVGIARRPLPTASAALLTGSDLAVGRRAFAARRAMIAASGIEVDLAGGRALAVTGPNGAGKSTLALTLAGLLPPVAGSLAASPALAAGLGRAPSLWRSRELLSRVGMVFQDPEHQLLTTKVRDELAVGPRALGREPAQITATVGELLDRLRLTRLADVNPFTLSGGEKRRLTVAAAIATAPRAVVLDEPTFGQDARTWREIASLLDALRSEGTALAFVTHDRELVTALADDELRIGAS